MEEFGPEWRAAPKGVPEGGQAEFTNALNMFGRGASARGPARLNPGELSKGRGKVASVSYRLSSRRSSEITLRVIIE